MPKSDTLIKVGDRAPEFTLKTCQGEPMSLSQILQKGKAFLLFFRGTW